MAGMDDAAENSMGKSNNTTDTPMYSLPEKTRASPQCEQPPLLSAPLEALPINHPSTIIEPHRRDLLPKEEGDFTEGREYDKDRITMVETSDLDTKAHFDSENPTVKNASDVENQRLNGPPEGLKIESALVDHLPEPNQQIKEEDLGLAQIQATLSPVTNLSMPSKGPSTKKRAPGGPRKPSAKKRKLDSRADTPQSQRSGTPNSMLGGRSASRPKKQNSATPLQSSPAPDDNDEEDDDDESDDGLYCICRKGDDHTWMIACDGGCDDWFHGRCIGIDQRDGNLIDKFICE